MDSTSRVPYGSREKHVTREIPYVDNVLQFLNDKRAFTFF